MRREVVATSNEAFVLIVAIDRFTPKSVRSEVVGSIGIDEYIAELARDDDWAAEFRETRRELSAVESGLSDLAKMRLQMGLSQRELAERANCSQPQIARLELGVGNPEVATLRKLAGVLGRRIDEVLVAFERARTA